MVISKYFKLFFTCKEQVVEFCTILYSTRTSTTSEPLTLSHGAGVTVGFCVGLLDSCQCETTSLTDLEVQRATLQILI